MARHLGFIALQESHIEDVRAFDVRGFWGKSQVEFEGVPSVGSSGGIVSMWDPDCFRLLDSIKDRFFLVTRGSMQEGLTKCDCRQCMRLRITPKSPKFGIKLSS